MKILKILNNNAVSTLNENNEEIIILGKGIGFKKTIGDEIDDTLIDKTFRSLSDKQTQFEKLVSEIPYQVLDYADTIISRASEKLDKRLNDNIYITLSDHLNYAIERYKEGIHIKNTLMWEIQRYYKDEYLVGVDAIQYINEHANIHLPEDEVGFIALHIVNAEMDSNQSLTLPVMIKDIVNIVRYSYNIEFDESSLEYDRFVRHVKFFVERSLNNKLQKTDDPAFFHDFNKTYPKEYGVALKIKKYIENKTDVDILEEELMYLTLHIMIITRNVKA